MPQGKDGSEDQKREPLESWTGEYYSLGYEVTLKAAA